MVQRAVLICVAVLLQQCEGRLQVVRVALSETKNDIASSRTSNSFFNNDEDLESEESIYSIEEERRELFTRTLQTGMSMPGGGMGSPDGMGGGGGMNGGGMDSPDGMGGGGMNAGGMSSPDGMGGGGGGMNGSPDGKGGMMGGSGDMSSMDGGEGGMMGGTGMTSGSDGGKGGMMGGSGIMSGSDGVKPVVIVLLPTGIVVQGDSMTGGTGVMMSGSDGSTGGMMSGSDGGKGMGKGKGGRIFL